MENNEVAYVTREEFHHLKDCKFVGVKNYLDKYSYVSESWCYIRIYENKIELCQNYRKKTVISLKEFLSKYLYLQRKKLLIRII